MVFKDCMSSKSPGYFLFTWSKSVCVCISVEGTVVTHTHTLFWGKVRRVSVCVWDDRCMAAVKGFLWGPWGTWDRWSLKHCRNKTGKVKNEDRSDCEERSWKVSRSSFSSTNGWEPISLFLNGLHGVLIKIRSHPIIVLNQRDSDFKSCQNDHVFPPWRNRVNEIY